MPTIITTAVDWALPEEPEPVVTHEAAPVDVLAALAGECLRYGLPPGELPHTVASLVLELHALRERVAELEDARPPVGRRSEPRGRGGVPL